jgi:hypothetical protein
MTTDELATGLPWVERIAASFPSHDFVGFHREELPALLEQHVHLAIDDLRDVPPLAFRNEEGVTFTWIASADGVQVAEGDRDAATLVELRGDAFSDFVNELLTASGAISTGRARPVRGTKESWQRWEPAIRAIVDGRGIYGPDVLSTLIDRQGRPYELGHSFAADAPMDEMRDFFATMGYLHVRGVFDAGEIAILGNEVERARAGTTPGDGFSWWSVTSTGEQVVTRINHVERFSSALGEFAHDERLARFARLAGEDLRVADDRLDGPMVFVKNADVVQGNGNLVWHVDDGIGGHPVMCPLIQAGVQLDPANAANGQLMLLAGSHRYAKHWIAWGDEGDLPVVALDTEPGDLTLHDGDTMHSTPAPTSPDAGRRALYYKFAEPKTFEWIPPHCHYNDVLFRPDDSGRVAANASTWSTY